MAREGTTQKTAGSHLNKLAESAHEEDDMNRYLTDWNLIIIKA